MDLAFGCYTIELEKTLDINSDMFLIADHHFIRSSRDRTIQKVTFKELYWFSVKTAEHKAASQNYFEKKFVELNLS